MHRAAKVALTPPSGPVFLSLPGDILNQSADIDLGSATRVEAAGRPTDATLERLAERLLAAERPVVITGHEVATSDALGEAARFAEILGAPVWQQTVASGAHFFSEHPAFMGSIERHQPTVRETLSAHDLLVVLGADVLRTSVWHEVDALPDGMAVVQISQRDWEMGKNYPTEIAVRSDVRETLIALNPLLEEKGGAARVATAQLTLDGLAPRNWSAKRERARESALAVADSTPIDPDFLMMRIAESLPADAVVVDEGLTSTNTLRDYLPYRDRGSYFGMMSGGIGWGVAAAVGVQLADRSRPVLAISGDGSAMYSIQALWTAAHHKLPLTYLICDNGGYRIIKQRLLSFHGSDHYIGMDFEDPPIDIVTLAESLGMPARRITDPAEVGPAVEKAMGQRRGESAQRGGRRQRRSLTVYAAIRRDSPCGRPGRSPAASTARAPETSAPPDEPAGLRPGRRAQRPPTHLVPAG